MSVPEGDYSVRALSAVFAKMRQWGIINKCTYLSTALLKAAGLHDGIYHVVVAHKICYACKRYPHMVLQYFSGDESFAFCENWPAGENTYTVEMRVL
jgi:hypothetical protein